MTTHRSLNKLEYRAHMSIHNTAEVGTGEYESHDSAYTRDRLGRHHRLFEGDGTSRIFKPASVLAAVSAFLILCGTACAVPENVSISSEDLDQKTFNDRLGNSDPKEEKFSIFDDGYHSLGFNEDGDPSLATRF